MTAASAAGGYPAARLPPCPPGGPRPAEVTAAAAGWVASPALADLVRAFGGRPPSGPLPGALDELERFSARVWDYRRGGERGVAGWPEFPDPTDRLVRAAAAALGLTGRQLPPGDGYDQVLVLGGGVRTSLARAELAGRLLAGLAGAPPVAGLGSLRPLSGREKEAGEQLGQPGLACEADAVQAALQRVFPPVQPGPDRAGVSERGEPWRVRGYRAAGREVHVLAAPPSRPGRRADTADTLVGWAELVARPAAGDRLLLVTTDLFVPFQHCDAVRLLGLRHGCGVDSVGFDTTVAGWVGRSPTGYILQEVRSAIRSMQALVRAVSGSAAD